MKARIRKNNFKNRPQVSKSQMRLRQRSNQAAVKNALKSKMLDDLLAE